MADEVVVVGQIARDLVLRVEELPAEGTAAPVGLRLEMLGGKGANQAVALAQLGVPVTLLGVVGDDPVADTLLAQARADGIDVTPVIRRAGATTGLIVNVLDARGKWRYLEDLPDAVLLTEDDVAGAGAVLRRARCVVVQLQQPSAAALAAATRARDAGALVVAEGAPADDDRRDRLLAAADVLRADEHEAELLTGTRLTDAADAVEAGRELVARHGLSLVALGAPGGNAFVWPDGATTIPHGDEHVEDTTGAGDALTAALTSVLCRGGGPEEAARLAVAAAGATVAHPGGRPDLTPDRLRRFMPGQVTAGTARDGADRAPGPGHRGRSAAS
jgi:ribokinase